MREDIASARRQVSRAFDEIQRALDVVEALDAIETIEPAAPEVKPPLLITLPDAAAEIGVSRTCIFQLVKDGLIPTVEMPNSSRRIHHDDLLRFVEERRTPSRQQDDALIQRVS